MTRLRLNDAIELFELSRSSDLSPRTLEDYSRYLAYWLGRTDNPLVTEVTKQDLERFMAHMTNEYRAKHGGPLSQSGLHNCWCALRSFWGWMSERYDDVDNVSLILKMPTVPEPMVVAFTKDEVVRLIDACEYTTRARTSSRRTFRMSRPEAERDIAIIYVLLDTGIRAGELSRLDVADIDIQNGELRVRPYRSGKKSRPRLIPFSNRTGAMLFEWIIVRREIYGSEDLPDDLPLFCSVSPRTSRVPGGRLLPRGLHAMIARLGERAGVKDAHPHRFRHTFATMYLINGGDPFTLKDLLGHSDMKMVQRYLNFVRQDYKAIHNRASAVRGWGL